MAAALGAAAMESGNIEVWKIPLEIADDLSSLLVAGLDEVEATRAEQFRYPLHRRRFVARRALTRLILGRYLGLGPNEIRYDLGEHGKPVLSRATLDAACTKTPDLELDALRFNLSHSHELALLAVTVGEDLGVDVEQHLGRRADRESAERFFAEKEVRDLVTLTGDRYVAGFFKCWTSKEAFVKALGCGLSVDLDRFAVCVSPETPAALVWADPDLTDSDQWSLTRFAPAKGYSAALATRARGYRVLERSFDASSITDAELASLRAPKPQ
jgi:4'-phosphopantetheinyl transferase